MCKGTEVGETRQLPGAKRKAVCLEEKEGGNSGNLVGLVVTWNESSSNRFAEKKGAEIR